MTEAFYREVVEKPEVTHKAGCQIPVSGMLKYFSIFCSGYRACLTHVPSNTERCREAVKAKIVDIYDESKQNYSVLTITKEL